MKKDPNGTLHAVLSDSVLPPISTLNAGIIARALPKTAPEQPHNDARSGLRALSNAAKPPKRIIAAPQRKNVI
jgi:hypothetical protein